MMDIYKLHQEAYLVTEKLKHFPPKQWRDPNTEIAADFKAFQIIETLPKSKPILGYLILPIRKEFRRYEVVLVLQNCLSTPHSCVEYLWVFCQLFFLDLLNPKQLMMLRKQANSLHCPKWHLLLIWWSNGMVDLSLLL